MFDDLQVLISAIIDEAKSIVSMKSQLKSMGEKLTVPVTAKLDKAKSRQQLQSDLSTFNKLFLSIIGRLDRSKTKKNIKSDLNAVSADGIKLKATVDTSALRKTLKSVSDKSTSVDVDAKVDGAGDLNTLADGMDNINRKSSATVASVTLLHQAILGLERAAKEMITTSTELDQKLTDLRMVTGDSYEGAKLLVDQYNALAKELGATTGEVLDASSEWLRQGMSTEQAATLIEQSMILSKVGAMDSAEATKNLTSAMKGYGMTVEEVAGIVDRLTAIDLQAAVTASDLAVAMSRTANSASISGVSMDRLLGYLATVQEVTQKSAETIGESFKTIFARMGNVKLGNFMSEDGEDLSDVESVLKHFGIALRDSEDEFRNFSDVLDDVYAKWDQFTNIDKRAIANAFAGVRQQENFLVLMENYGTALEYAGVAADSAGTAIQKFGAYQDSLQAKINAFTASFESLSMNTFDAEFLGTIVQAGTALVEFIDNTNLLKIALAGLAAAGVVKGFTIISSHAQSAYANISKLSTAFDTLSKASSTGLNFEQFQRLLSVTDGLNASQLRLIVSNKALTNEQRMAILMASGLTSEQAAQTLATMGLTAAETSATTATFSLSGAFKALSAAIAANPIGFLIVALTTAATVISTVISGMEQAREETIQLAEATIEEKNAVLDATAAFKSAYSEYLQYANITNRTAEEEAAFQTAVENVTDALGEKAGVLEGLKAGTQGYTDELNKAAQAELELAYIAAKQKRDAATDALQATTYSGWSGSEITIDMSGRTGIDEFVAAYETAERVMGEYFDEGTWGKELEPIGWDTDHTNMDAVVDYYYRLLDLQNELAKENNMNNDIYDDAVDITDKLKDSVEAYVAARYDEIAAEYEFNNGIPSNMEEFKQYRDYLNDELSKEFSFNGSSGSVAEMIDGYLAETGAYADYLNDIVAEEAEIARVNERIQAITDALVPKTYEELTPGTSAHFHALDSWSAEVESVKDKLEALSDEDFEIAYNAVINEGATTWEDITAAIEEYNSEQAVAARNAEALQSRIRGMWDSEDFSDTKEELIAMSQAVDGITPQNIEELASESSVLAGILEEDGMNAQFLSKILQNMAEGGDGVSLVTAEALKLNDALDGMVDKFDQVTDAKSRYDAAMAVEEKDADFRSYAEAFEELNAQFEAGTTNSNAFWAAAEFLFGSEQLNTWGWSDGLDEIYDAMQRNKSVFEDADSAGAGFIQRLYDMAQAGQLVNDEGENLIEISKDATGAFDFDVDPENLDEIAEKMGITEEAVIACFEALSMWGDIDFYDLTEVSEVIDEIGLSAETAAGKAINVDRLTEQLMTLGKTDKEIYDVLSALQGLDGVQLFSVSGDIDSVTTSLQNLGLATSDDYTITVNYEGLGDLLANIGYTKEEAEGLITKLGEADGISLANADGQVQSVSDALDYIDTITFTNVTTSINGVETAIDDVNDSTTSNAESEIDDIGSAAQDAATKVYSIGTAIDSVNGRTATVYYNVQRKGGLIDSIGNLLGFAKGTSNAPAGNALLGDEYSPNGSPKPELVVSKDGAYLAGTNGPEIAYLNQGDQVYTADETKRILSRSGKRITGTIPAYASGRITTSGLRVEVDKNGSTGTPYTSPTTTATVDVKAEVDDEELAEEMEDAIKEIQDELDEILGNYEHDIFTLERNDGTPEEIIAIYRKMQDTVHQYAEKYRAMGLDENNDYIQELGEQWWEYQDEIDDILHGIYTDAVEAHENTIELLQHQYDGLSDSKNYRDMATNLERQRQEQLRIQELAHEEAQRLRALGVDENDEAIQECIDAWWDAEDDIKEINESIVDNVLEPFDEFIEYADDFDLWDRFDFTKVDYLRQKIAALNRLLEQGVLTLREYTELLRETQLDIYNEQKDAITEIIEKTMELVRQEAEDKIDALEEQIDDYQKIIDLKKESLEVARDEEDYEREVAERVAEIAKVQEKINQLSRDDSREANAERQQLEQELAELQNDLADYQADYAYDAQVDALDKEADKFEETKDNEIAKVEASVDTEEEVYRAAIDRINADWDQLYQDLIAWNRQYGDMIDGEDSITSAWQTAMQAAQEYGDIVSALNGINNDIANEQQGILDQQQEDAEISAIMSEMYANGQAWGSASDEEKQRLADENLRLGRLLAPYGINAVRGDDGVWYVDRVGGEQLFQKYRQYIYHDGGIVGEDSLKSNEVFAKLQKGEAVFTSKQYKNLFSQIGDTITGVVDSVVRSLATAKDTTAAAIQSVTNNENTDNSMGEIRIENHFEVKNSDEETAKKMAEYYADYTIDKLIVARKRKGVRNSVGSHMLR